MKILAIDTSCDDTCLSILEVRRTKKVIPKFKILSNIVSSQVKIHQKYGGVVPALAKREHQKNLIPLLKKCFKKTNNLQKKKFSKKISNLKAEKVENFLKREGELYQKTKIFLERYKKPKINFIAVTQGPGLEPALWSGINFARTLSYFWQIPLVPVNHIEAHIFANFIGRSKSQILKLKTLFPAIGLVVSGGHTELILMKKIRKYRLLGETRDDAAGECLDKVAKILELSYPGGPEIEKLAKRGKDVFNLPRPMINSKDYDFSFAGLKTAVLYLTRKIKREKLKNLKLKANMATSVQQAVIDVLISKTIRAAKEFKVRTVLLGGGVIANKELRKQFKETIKRKYPLSNIYYPLSMFCTDNAVMIGISDYFKSLRKKEVSLEKIKADPNLKI
ncbi:MAG: tRNA (adenosine(37)-N6)-threonylcarbamoyltransferase complex transferase subunit TsaD [Parcubacteria group bacterium CG_4_9_14_0_2_um_filter_35_11]|nr:MAG: tRNA (adenosine(37)-N6)-threonylcarbamoyltransferase complex transferase subunit TsaD [Parcubacteria group bacterium CG_4_9_14_0_2_um_filter_35_11]